MRVLSFEETIIRAKGIIHYCYKWFGSIGKGNNNIWDYWKLGVEQLLVFSLWQPRQMHFLCTGFNTSQEIHSLSTFLFLYSVTNHVNLWINEKA